MNPHFEELDVTFSTADVSALAVSCSARALTVDFADWRGAKSTVVFRDVAAYKWDESSFEHFDASPDRVYRVRESQWLARWPESVGYTHYVFGFCGLPPVPTGYLEVIAKTMELTKEPNQALEPTTTAVTDRAAHAPRQP
jgi:hypothetical protein